MEQPISIPLWDGIVVGGPIILALHLCIFASFAFAVRFAFRVPGTVAAFAWSLAPFIFGAVAMWFGVLGYTAVVPSFFSGLYDGDPTFGIRLLQRPFFFGAGLSLVAVVIYFLARARHPNTRNA